MERSTCLNVRSVECAVATVRGRRVVMYAGDEYYIIGLYFGHGPNGRRELRYVLSAIPDRDRHLPFTAGDRR